MHHENFPKSVVLFTEAWQGDNVQLSVVTGDEGRLGYLYICLHLQGKTKTQSLFAKLTSKQFYKISTDYSMHCMLEFQQLAFTKDS